MKPFYQIAIPHDDIKERRFTLDTYAADLWSVHTGKGPEEYRNPELFWERTYMTAGLKTLLDLAERRLKGEGGDAVLQLQTPFGGGKTHTLIALYHKAKEWGAKVVVIDGNSVDAKTETLWGLMEEQLRGSIAKFAGEQPPKKDDIIALLEESGPTLILIDELLSYLVVADSVPVGNDTMATLTINFMQRLSEAVKAVGKALLAVTLQSSNITEIYGSQRAEELYHAVQNTVGRASKVVTPVSDQEIYDVIRKRLFKRIDMTAAEEVIREITDYMEARGLLPEGMSKAEYRERFRRSYPFQPEVIEVLYTRWGSFAKFQRTRGVLRILSIVTANLIGAANPVIRLADFDLSDEDLRNQLIISATDEPGRYYSVLAKDITGENAGAKKVDRALGDAFEPFKIGTKVATTIFMYSFVSGGIPGATKSEIKRSCVDLNYDPPVVDSALLGLRETLLFLHEKDGRFFFSTEQNINSLFIQERDNVADDEIEELEKELLSRALPSRPPFKTYIWPRDSRDIPDGDYTPKIVAMKEYDSDSLSKILNTAGTSPRTNKNTLIFLVPKETERGNFVRAAKAAIAWGKILQRIKDSTIELKDDQKMYVKNAAKNASEKAILALYDLYRIVLVPSKNGFDEFDLGMRASGDEKKLTDLVREKLEQEGRLITRLTPMYLVSRYLSDREYVSTQEVFRSHISTPGMPILSSKSVLIDAIRQGVKDGEFGLGYISDGSLKCVKFGEGVTPVLDDTEIIIRKEICAAQRAREEAVESAVTATEPAPISGQASIISSAPQTVEQESAAEQRAAPTDSVIRGVSLRLKVPLGGLPALLQMLQALNNKFQKVELVVQIHAADGEMTKQEYEDIVEENIQQGMIEEL